MEKKHGDTMWSKPFALPFEELKAASKERVKAVGTGLDEFMQAVAAQSSEGQPADSDFGLADLEEKLQRLKRKVCSCPLPPTARKRGRMRLLPSSASTSIPPRAGGAQRAGGGGRCAALQSQNSAH